MTTSPIHPCPVNCIVPPHMLESIVRNGSERQRDGASRTLIGDASLRERRAARRRARRAPREGLLAEAPPVTAEAAPVAVKDRQICDAIHELALPGALVRGEGDAATSDVAVDEAFDGMGSTWDLYNQVFSRNSYDNAGGQLIGSVHYQNLYNNAFWDGTQMVYGDGDGTLFNRFTIAIDVIGHELTHAVTETESQLIYQGQSGALNESLSDVFGSLVKQWSASPQQTADTADWLIGAGLLASGVSGVALRSMKEPGTAYDDDVLGKDPQPGHMDQYVETDQDNGGVHINSGIPNHAFFFLATALGGFAWERPGQIWYAAAIDQTLAAESNFQQFAELTAVHALALGAAEHQATVDAWQQVGVAIDG